MQKRISYRDFQAVKSVAKAIDPKVRERESLKKKIEALAMEYKRAEEQINLLEAGIVNTLGIRVTDAVRKEITVTGTDPKTGKPIKSTKYVLTSNVSYDEAKKQYIIDLPDEPKEENIQVPSPDASGYGNDFDADKEKIQQEAEHQPDYIDPVEMNIFQ